MAVFSPRSSTHFSAISAPTTFYSKTRFTCSKPYLLFSSKLSKKNLYLLSTKVSENEAVVVVEVEKVVGVESKKEQPEVGIKEEETSLGSNGGVSAAVTATPVEEQVVLKFINPKWFSGTWDLKQFEKNGKTDWDAVIDAVERNRQQKKKEAALDVYNDSRSHSGTTHTNWKLTSVREALSINLSTFDKPLRKLTFADLLEATNGFHNDSLIGSGGFGDVYKARLKDGSIVAVKKLIQISGQGDREFTAEMETIGKIKHRNLVPLLGYCKVGEERLLVYEYMRFGSLEDVLHERKKVGIKLKWAARRKFAIGAARGLAFLHHNCIPHIIHKDMKSSNVFLDENLEARVSDFGMTRLMSAMDTHPSVSTLAGTPGYVPPEYYQSFRCSTKGDVYSYGVVLLELLTGKQPTDSADFGDNNLVGWVKQHAKLKISDVFDPDLMKEDPTLEIELLHLKVACACLDDRPWRRPTMIQVMAMFKEIQAGSSIDSSVSTIDQDRSFHTIDMVEMTIKEGQELNTKHYPELRELTIHPQL